MYGMCNVISECDDISSSPSVFSSGMQSRTADCHSEADWLYGQIFYLAEVSAGAGDGNHKMQMHQRMKADNSNSQNVIAAWEKISRRQSLWWHFKAIYNRVYFIFLVCDAVILNPYI